MSPNRPDPNLLFFITYIWPVVAGTIVLYQARRRKCGWKWLAVWVVIIYWSPLLALILTWITHWMQYLWYMENHGGLNIPARDDYSGVKWIGNEHTVTLDLNSSDVRNRG